MQDTPVTPGEPPVTGRRRPRLNLSELDLRNTIQVAVGAVLVPLGLVIIILGWLGAAYSHTDQGQIPYLISGGLIGLAVVSVGCFFYWGHWLYRIYDQADLHHQESMRVQREILEAISSGPARSGVTLDPIVLQAPPANGSRRTFVATATGTNFHTPGCPMVANRTAGLRTLSETEVGRMKPCRVCDPLVSVH